MKVKDLVPGYMKQIKADHEHTLTGDHTFMASLDEHLMDNLPEDVDVQTYLQARQVILLDQILDRLIGDDNDIGLCYTSNLLKRVIWKKYPWTQDDETNDDEYDLYDDLDL